MTPLFQLTTTSVLAHMIGDYVLQSDWMASQKTSSWKPALAHVLTYAIPFVLLCTHNPIALFIIVSTHFVIDHWRLARYVCWVKNFLAPKHIDRTPPRERQHFVPESEWFIRNLPWSECTATGYDPAKPAWLSVWLLILTDNIMHVTINALALTYFP